MNRYTYTPNKIRFLQLNCNRSSLVINTILDIAVNTADIIILQETGLADDTYNTTHPDFELFRPPRKSHKTSRTAIFAAKNNPYLTITPRLDLSDDPDLQAIDITTPTITTTTILNIYNEHEGESGLFTIPRTLTTIANKGLPPRCIITGDMNAHHSWWDSRIRSPKRADELVEIMLTHDYDLLNTPDTPTYQHRTGTGSSVLDLTFASPELNNLATNWAVDDDAFAGSDHETIRFELLSPHALTQEAPTTQRFNWDKADWQGLCQHLTTYSTATRREWLHLHDNPSPGNLDKAAEHLRDLLLEAIRKYIPTSNICDRSKRWWNPTILAARKEMKRHHKAWKESRSPELHVIYKATRNEYFRGIKAAKADTWKQFLADATGKDIYQAMKYTKPRKTQSTPNINAFDTTATTFDTKALLFRRAMFPPPPTDNTPTLPSP